MSLDPLRNPKDPFHTSGPEKEKELFTRFSQLSEGFPVETVVRAAMNVVLNAIRQAHAKRSGAETSFDELIARSKSVLLDQHYDNAGNRRNVFPFDQKIEISLFSNRHKF
jgi:hypothetical protein